MACLDCRNNSWWRYAVEFSKRGLWPIGEIETHGPHGFPADRIWGVATCSTDDRNIYEISFAGPTGCRTYYDIKGLRMKSEDGEISFPILPVSERNHRVRAWVAYAYKKVKTVDAVHCREVRLRRT